MLAKPALLRFVLALCFSSASFAFGDNAAFDLAGPKLEVRVVRAGKALPISQIPNLQAGDRIWLHPEFPKAQSVKYLLIAAFLRGSTNPPPEEWFVRAETWKRDVREEGIYVTVPEDAQQALVFLAPETGGDFGTLRSNVRGKPGAFVRASQDLGQASLDRSRLDAYLSAVKQTAETEPDKIKERTTLLARSLGIKLDTECFDKPTAQQAPCLMQGTEQLVLDDGQSESMVAALTSGPSSDLIGNLGGSRIMGAGVYSPYIGAFVDVARIMGSFHSADYRYLPALALPKQDKLNLRLNNVPTFHKPKSVLVVGLPAVEATQLPPMRAVDGKQQFCLEKPGLVLPVEGAPLVFATELAHDMALRISDKSGKTIELPARADASRGGFAVDTRSITPASWAAEPGLNGVLHGLWGFDRFDGPAFRLRMGHTAKWTIPTEEQSSLIVGRDGTLHVESEDAVCVEQITVKDAHDKALKTTWKLDSEKPNRLNIQIPLKDRTAGPLTVLVKEYERGDPEKITLHAYSEAARLDHFVINAGDRQGVLKGTRLDQVASLELSSMHFVPAELSRTDQKDELKLNASDGKAATVLGLGDSMARVTLKDERVLQVQADVAPPRPRVTLIAKNIEAGHSATFFRLGSKDLLPQDGRLSFFLKTQVPDTFSRNEKIEVACAGDKSFNTTLSVSDGSLTLEDSQTVLATLDPLKSFGSSAFGPLQFRPVGSDGRAGDWEPLVTLVRVPVLKDIHCPDAPDKQCLLGGANLFLMDSVASDEQFLHNVPVPSALVEVTLRVPRPNGTLLYIKLRDDPSVVNKAVLPVLPEQ